MSTKMVKKLSPTLPIIQKIILFIRIIFYPHFKKILFGAIQSVA